MPTDPDPRLLELMGLLHDATTALRHTKDIYARVSHDWRSASDNVNAASTCYEDAKKQLDTYIDASGLS